MARVIVAPGEVDLRMRAIADGWTVDFLRRITRRQRASSPAPGFDLEHGLTTRAAPAGRRAGRGARVRRPRGRASSTPPSSGARRWCDGRRARELDAVVVDAGADAEMSPRRGRGVALEIASGSHEPGG